MKTDEHYMRRCIDLALKGMGNVAPNPMVGAVIVLNDEVVGEGYHQQFGEAHAEVNAVASVHDTSLLKDATIYVSLEPCAHFGKTPPCADLIVHHQFKRVVIGCLDSYSEVSGKGIQRMREHGILVDVGVLEAECRELNKRFFTFYEKKRPYIILKWAQSADGFLDKTRKKGEVGINWITQATTKNTVHQWRAEETAILVGKNTVLNDNPTLTVQNVQGKNPIRIVLDSNLEVPMDAAIFNQEASTLIINTRLSKEEGTNKWLKIDKLDVHSIVETLFDESIQSVIIEGGRQVLESFISTNLWDEARVLVGTPVFNSGLKAPVLLVDASEEVSLEEDRLLLYRNLKG